MPELQFLNGLDYLVVVLYMAMVLAVGVIVSRYNRRTTDYFKGAGHIPWGLSAISLFISGFSAFMFVGASGVAYQNGVGALVLFSLAGPAYMFGYWIYGPRWRRTRIDTPMQFLGRRFSPGTTYVYTLLAVIPNVLTLGIWIYMLCIFTSTALGFNTRLFDLGFAEVNGFQLSLIVTGAVMVVYTMLGGLWAVMVTDALQFVILLLVTLIMVPVAYFTLGDGSLTDGVARLVREAPEGYFDVGLDDQVPIFWLVYFINIVLGYNVNWHIAQRYYSVPDERDTRKMALWCSGLSLILPALWILPVLAARVLFPDIDALWPELAKPAEASFVTLALAILPHGMLGVMVAAIFAATMSSADTTFNWLAAVLTKDVFLPVRNALGGEGEPSERVQLAFAKGSVAVMGLLAIWIALNMERFGGAFDVYLRADSLVKPAMAIPVLLGLVYTRTPWWSGIGALVLGVLGILGVGVAANLSQGLPVTPGGLFSDIQVTLLGIEMGRYELNTLAGVTISAAVFFGSAFFNRREGAYAERIARFEADMRTPAHAPPGARLDLRGLRAYRLAARLAIGIGLLLWIFAVPTWGDGAGLNLIGGTLALTGGTLVLYAIRRYTGALEPAAVVEEDLP